MISWKACKNCSSITDQNKCPRCGGEVSREWQVIDGASRPDAWKRSNSLQ